jgi:trehalose 6-phosphate synthase/phosphatase
MNDYSNRVPGSILEKKEYALSWHYRNSPPQYGEYQARKLLSELETVLSHQPASILKGKKVVEARILEANKGQFVHWYLKNLDQNDLKSNKYLIAIGDDKTDEDMFEAIGDFGTSLRVGEPATRAPYCLKDLKHVVTFLEYLDKKLI